MCWKPPELTDLSMRRESWLFGVTHWSQLSRRWVLVHSAPRYCLRSRNSAHMPKRTPPPFHSTFELIQSQNSQSACISLLRKQAPPTLGTFYIRGRGGGKGVAPQSELLQNWHCVYYWWSFQQLSNEIPKFTVDSDVMYDSHFKETHVQNPIDSRMG